MTIRKGYGPRRIVSTAAVFTRQPSHRRPGPPRPAPRPSAPARRPPRPPRPPRHDFGGPAADAAFDASSDRRHQPAGAHARRVALAIIWMARRPAGISTGSATNPWIIPGNRRAMTGTPAARNLWA